MRRPLIQRKEQKRIDYRLQAAYGPEIQNFGSSITTKLKLDIRRLLLQ